MARWSSDDGRDPARQGEVGVLDGSVLEATYWVDAYIRPVFKRSRTLHEFDLLSTSLIY